jgi:2-amino-4-hydroxy-6-hydroxymethyldihydropteridine diphosphokinase
MEDEDARESDAAREAVSDTSGRGHDWTIAYIALGSNLGDRAANLWAAVQRLSALEGCRLEAVSPLYESEPVGPAPQGLYLNAVAAAHVAIPALGLLRALKGIERELGRVPSVRWGPRHIDLDLLLHGDMVLENDELTLPHPELWNRRFVLQPLLDVVQRRELRSEIAQRLGELGITPAVWRYAPALRSGTGHV